MPSDEREASARRRRFSRATTRRSCILVAVMLALGAYIYRQNDRYLARVQHHARCCCWSARSASSRMGQTIALMTGGIDLSVGPLAGFLVVVGSFFLTTTSSGELRSCSGCPDGRARGPVSSGSSTAP